MSVARPGAPAVLRVLGGLHLLLLLLLLWSPAALSDCPPPAEVPNAQPDLRGLTSFPLNTTVTYRCNDGFVKIPGKAESVVCLDNDQWSQISEFCNRSCEVPPRLQYGILIQKYRSLNYFPVGFTVDYECRLGYRRAFGVSARLTCLQSLEWTTPEKFCDKKSCPNPGELVNGHINITTDILFGATIYFSCDTGYNLVGESSSLCVVTGNNVEWSNPLPICRVIYCRDPPTIDNGRIISGESGQYTYNHAVGYACDRGFTLIGERTIYCTASGEEGVWSSPPPRCQQGKSPPGKGPTPGPIPTTSSTVQVPSQKPTKETPQSPATQTEQPSRTTMRPLATSIPKGGDVPSGTSPVVHGLVAVFIIITTVSLGMALWRYRSKRVSH
ncbi:complement decay-accelerating factor isoform X3 [Nycticebus coucang]|uniref:complement decay-accelerating factor isoform X3 n=1 Tax=Nycticebus coucang TaxID=9470 RepID=UPI00234D14CD|nr:complement decay-accelerating factor isoform X3 [Nycticebus coucang]